MVAEPVRDPVEARRKGAARASRVTGVSVVELYYGVFVLYTLLS